MTAYITLAHKLNGDWDAADWTISTGKASKSSALERARYAAKKFAEDGYEHVSIREVGDHGAWEEVMAGAELD